MSTNHGEILSIQSKMAELLVNYTQNNFIRTLVQVENFTNFYNFSIFYNNCHFDNFDIYDFTIIQYDFNILPLYNLH